MDAVERLAAAELRSTNAQLEVLIREALGKRGIKLDAAKRRGGKASALSRDDGASD